MKLLSEEKIYKFIEEFVNWYEEQENSRDSLMAFLSMMSNFNKKEIHILLCSLSDGEIPIKSKTITNKIINCLYDDNKCIAQAAVLCLVNCCDVSCKAVKRIINDHEPKHSLLVSGMLDFLK